ncbi:MAG: 1-(5-phosphoribosyl)-5-[(5-phosphoribosylamino)methylideneamino] imidazole-4-carboxamide isomerase [Proteobacteria bacterium]|nr:1-(5-phosphoribosyl)-5-[(5-phosphoribosylamino)methylideneamino] imidazole-4-carboxamide isomerase [Pseudomonadota bacterium]
MLLMPAIDLRGGGVVRLHQGDFDSETRYDADPLALLERYRAAGAAWLHVVDLDAARAGAAANREIIAALAGRGAQPGALRIQAGGGVRTRADVQALLNAGCARVIVGSLAADDPQQVRGWLTHFGPGRLCLAFDVRLDDLGVPRVRTHGWLRGGALSLWDALACYPSDLSCCVLCTDIGRDGTLAGPNTDLYREAVRRFPALQWQASGGIRDAADLAALARTGVAAAVSGRALLEQQFTAQELSPYLPAA